MTNDRLATITMTDCPTQQIYKPSKSLRISNCYFADFTQRTDGSCIYVTNSALDLDIRYITAIRCSVTQHGAVIYAVDVNNFVVCASCFRQCVAQIGHSFFATPESFSLTMTHVTDVNCPNDTGRKASNSIVILNGGAGKMSYHNSSTIITNSEGTAICVSNRYGDDGVKGKFVTSRNTTGKWLVNIHTIDTTNTVKQKWEYFQMVQNTYTDSLVRIYQNGLHGTFRYGAFVKNTNDGADFVLSVTTSTGKLFLFDCIFDDTADIYPASMGVGDRNVFATITEPEELEFPLDGCAKGTFRNRIMLSDLFPIVAKSGIHLMLSFT